MRGLDFVVKIPTRILLCAFERSFDLKLYKTENDIFAYSKIKKKHFHDISERLRSSNIALELTNIYIYIFSFFVETSLTLSFYLTVEQWPHTMKIIMEE